MMELYKHFSNTIDGARKTSHRQKYKCLIPGCESNAIKRSHIIQQHPALESICDNTHKVIQPCIDEINPMAGLGELTKFRTLGITEAMSFPLFCKEHDDSIFAEIEKSLIDVNNPRHLLLLALRGVSATMFIDERLKLQEEYISEQSEILSGNVVDELIKGYQHNLSRYQSLMQVICDDLKANDYTQYQFIVIKLPNYKLAICDTYRDDVDWEEHILDDTYKAPMKVLFINVQNIGSDTYLILGYHKHHSSSIIEDLMSKWCTSIETEHHFKVLYDILLHCNNNWCVSPNCDVQLINYLKDNYERDKMKVTFGK